MLCGGIDILGPFPIVVSQKKFIVATIDYFIKWVEAEPLAIITYQKMINFVKKSIVCKLGALKIIITNNKN